MSGIYVHIPYCKVKCHYCDFHFSTNTSNASEMIQAICAEIKQRSTYLDAPVNTIYFGGGTPSHLNPSELAQIINAIHNHVQIADHAELTIECNPDDLDAIRLKILHDLGFNRLSIGIQSFDNDVLKLMNRAHSAQQALEAIPLAKEAGFQNITVDLIYGIPDKDISYWESQLDQVMELNVPHISSYCLTIEPNTVFGHQYKHQQLHTPSDEDTLDQFKLMINRLTSAGFQHYEISNFAKEGYISQHNTAYWQGKMYVGIGPSAHSYNGIERGWNIADNRKYIKQILNGQNVYEVEILTLKDKFNDYILTRLRTQWGIEIGEITHLGAQLDLSDFNSALQKHLGFHNLTENKGAIRMTEQGKFIIDKIAADLFI